MTETKTKAPKCSLSPAQIRDKVLDAVKAGASTVPGIVAACSADHVSAAYVVPALAYWEGRGALVSVGSHRWLHWGVDVASAEAAQAKAKAEQAARLGGFSSTLYTEDERTALAKLEAQAKSIREAAKARKAAAPAAPPAAPPAPAPAPEPPPPPAAPPAKKNPFKKG